MKRVVIVGAGVIGLCSAVRLARGGARVTLIEAENEDFSVYAPAASGAAAGMLAPFDTHGPAYDRLALESLDLWRAAQPDGEWADGVRFGGGVVIAPDEAQAAALLQRVRASGRHATALGPAQLRKHLGAEVRVDHAIFVEDEGVADPVRVLGGLYMQARTYGVTLAFGRDASLVEANRVETFEGDVYEADVVVLAPGAWATDALKQAAPALRHLRPAKGCLAPVQLPAGFAPNVRADGFYLARRRSGDVLGATMAFDTFDRRVDEDAVANLHAAAEAALPGLVKPAGKPWAGVRPMSPDGWPMIGDGGAGVLIAAGHSRQGWLLAQITAEVLSAHVFGLACSADWAMFAPDRFGRP